MSSLVGHDEVVFEQQCFDAGLRSRTRTLALVLDEATQQLIGAAAAEGVWAAFAYFQGATAEHRDLEERYSALQPGPMPPMSSLSETTYEAVIAYGRILAATGAELDKETLRRRLTVRSTSVFGEAHAVGSSIVLAESRHGIFRPR